MRWFAAAVLALLALAVVFVALILYGVAAGACEDER